MKKRALVPALAAIVFFAACGAPPAAPADTTAPPGTCAPAVSESAPAQTEPTQPAPPGQNECRYYDGLLLARHAIEADEWQLPQLKAAVAPHYAPMLDMLASALMAAAQSAPYDLVFIIGPDHEGAGGGISLSGRGWATPEGALPGEGGVAQLVLQSGVIAARENDELLQTDHAVSTLVPYVARFLPETPVVTALVGRHTDRARLKALAELIYGLQQQLNILLLCSIDFSHYQTPDDAQSYDEQTLNAVSGLDVTKILGMDSKNMDSPECMAVFVELCAMWGQTPAAVARRVDCYPEDGAMRAGTYMAWTLCAE